jgi:hypothetical protein
VPSTTKPEITVATPCGPKKVEPTGSALQPPNEANVVILELRPSNLPSSTKVLFAPKLTDPVKLGDITVSTPLPKELTIFDSTCGKPVTVGAESAPIPAGPVLVVAPRAMCLRSGLALYGTGSGCKAERQEQLKGKIIYPLPEEPYVVFAPLRSKIDAYVECSNYPYIQEC